MDSLTERYVLIKSLWLYNEHTVKESRECFFWVQESLNMRSLDRYNVGFSRVSSDSNEKNTFNTKVFWIDELVIEVYSLQHACRLLLMMAKRCQTHCCDNWWQTNWLLHFVWGEILARCTSATGEELLIGATVMEQLSMNGVDVTSICTMAHWGGRSWSTAEMKEMQRAATVMKVVAPSGSRQRIW